MKRFIFSILMIMIFFTACTGFTKLDTIRATDYFSGIRCEIPLKIPFGSPTSEFLHTNDSIEKLKVTLGQTTEEKNNFICEKLPYGALMVIYKESSKTALYLLQELTMNSLSDSEYKHKYRFSDFSSFLLSIPDSIERDIKISAVEGVPMPHYLFSDRSGTYYMNEKNMINGDIDAFYDFYKMFQKYYPDHPIEVEKHDKKLVLKNIPVNAEIVSTDGHSLEYRLLNLEQITFAFYDHHNRPVVNISHITYSH